MPDKCPHCGEMSYVWYICREYPKPICGECYDFLREREPPISEDELYKLESDYRELYMGRC